MMVQHAAYKLRLRRAANEQLRDMVMSNILIHITRDSPREHVIRTIFKGVRMY